MFAVPESEAAKPENRFVFLIADVEYDVPKLGFAPVEATILFEQGYKIEGLVACADSDEARAALRRLTSDQLAALEAAWISASKVAPGESQSSAGS